MVEQGYNLQYLKIMDCAFVCKSCFVQLRDFRRVRRFLTHDDSVLVANALVSS